MAVTPAGSRIPFSTIIWRESMLRCRRASVAHMASVPVMVPRWVRRFASAWARKRVTVVRMETAPLKPSTTATITINSACRLPFLKATGTPPEPALAPVEGVPRPRTARARPGAVSLST